LNNIELYTFTDDRKKVYQSEEHMIEDPGDHRSNINIETQDSISTESHA